MSGNGLRRRARARFEVEREHQIINDFTNQYDRYYANPNSSFYDADLERRFYAQKMKYIGYFPRPKDGIVTFGASQTALCDRQAIFKYGNVKPEKTDDIPFRGRQRRLGTAVIDYVQLDLVHMPKVLGDDCKFRVKENEDGEFMFEDAAARRRVFEVTMDDGYVCRFALFAKPDGILEYEYGDLLFEYKTKATGLRSMNSKLDYKGPDESHMRQVTAEALVFGIDEGIILYESTQKPSWFSDEENKSVTKGQKTWKDGRPLPDARPFYFRVTDEMKESLLNELARQARMIYEGDLPEVTPEMTLKCGFCQFRDHCHENLTMENIERLRETEARYARSSLAGGYAHRLLRDYLEGLPGGN